MSADQPLSMLCTYVPKPGKEAELQRLLQAHGPTMIQLGLQAPGSSVVWKATSRNGTVKFVERMDWVNRQAPDLAHQHPAVMAMWEPIGALCDSMDFSPVEVVAGAE